MDLQIQGGPILELVNAKGTVFLREAQVDLENRLLHWETLNRLRSLYRAGLIKARKRNGYTWFYKDDWSTVRDIALSKSRLIAEYSEMSNRGSWGNAGYDDYSEYLVSGAIVQNGFRIVERNSTAKGYDPSASGHRGRSKDLDFLMEDRNTRIRIGISVKNRLGYPAKSSIDSVIKVCEAKNVIPMLVTRKVPITFKDMLQKAAGYVIEFDEWLLHPGIPEGLSHALISELGYPIGIYTRTPAKLVEKFADASNWVANRHKGNI